MGRRGWLVAATVAALAAVGCGGPAAPPVGEEPDGTSADRATDGCRPALTDDDPHPLEEAGGGQHAALTGDWVGAIAEQVQTEHVDALGGLWLDNAAGELVIMVPGREGRDVFDRLRTDAPEPDLVVCMEATYTQAELSELQRQVFARITETGQPASGGADTVRNRVSVAVEGGLEEARAALGELADHPALQLEVPDCAEVVPPPEGATPLPGGGSNCQGMDALFTGTLTGDPASGCAWFEDHEGQPLTVVWPRGWSITEDGTILDHRGEPRAALGDDIESGGGSVPLAEGQRACGMGGKDGAWVVSSLTAVEEGASGE